MQNINLKLKSIDFFLEINTQAYIFMTVFKFFQHLEIVSKKSRFDGRIVKFQYDFRKYLVLLWNVREGLKD